MVELRRTPRGFVIGEFTDRYGIKCSILKSSLAEEDCIWLGVDGSESETTHMHLTQKMVWDLIPLLLCFLETGELPEP